MESPITLTIHSLTLGGIVFIAGLLMREHKVYVRVKDRLNTLWHDRCRIKGDDYVPLDNGHGD